MDFGRFPFGQPNTVRPARSPGASDAVIIGVYPSAWHVTWTAPERLRRPGASGRVQALAVDVEPTVFWDGSAEDFGARLTRWKAAVGFVDGEHGVVSSTSPSTNGSSGAKVAEQYLRPLGLDAARVTFTDIFPVFLVKYSGPNATRRQQGDAIRLEYDALAARMAMPRSSLPSRYPSTRLPDLAASMFGDRLVADLAMASPELVVTLGEEVWVTLLRLPELAALPPRPHFSDLRGDAYGSTGSLNVNGRRIPWLPLVHPGLLKGGRESGVDTAVAGLGWPSLHHRWASRGDL